MCCPTEEHIFPMLCVPLPRKHIFLVISVPLPGKHICLVICVFLRGKHVYLVIYVLLPVKHISLVICVSLPGKHVSPVIYVLLPGKYVSLVICVPLPKTFLTNLVFIFWLLFLFSHDQNRESSSTVHFSPKPQRKRLLRSKGFYYQILGAVTVLKFLQTLALDFLHICLQFFPGKFYRQMYRKC